jgi:hypothetical protein
LWWLLLLLLLLLLTCLAVLAYNFYQQLSDEERTADEAAKTAKRQELQRRIEELRNVVGKNTEAFQLMQMTRVPRSRVQPLREMMAQNVADTQKLQAEVQRANDPALKQDGQELQYLEKELQALLDMPDSGPSADDAVELELQQALDTKNHAVLEEAVANAEAKVAAGAIVVPASLHSARKVLQDMERASKHSYSCVKGTRSLEDFLRGRAPLDADANYHRKNSVLKPGRH